MQGNVLAASLLESCKGFFFSDTDLKGYLATQTVIIKGKLMLVETCLCKIIADFTKRFTTMLAKWSRIISSRNIPLKTFQKEEVHEMELEIMPYH
jgi:hypothetical protein